MVGLTAIALGPLAESALMPWSQRWRAARSSSPSTDLEAVVPVVRKPAEARPGRWLLAHDEVHEPWSLETHRAVATHTRRQAPRALWLTRLEAAWNVISALLPLAYLWSLPLLARAGFCERPGQWRWGPQASINRYINNPWATAALGGACFFAAMDMWRFGGVGLKAEGFLPSSHPIEFGASRLALFCVQLSLGAMLALSDAWHPALHLVATGCFCASALAHNALVAHASHDVFGRAFNANLGIGSIAAALTIGCVVEMSRTVGLPWPGSPSPDHVFWVCETLGLSSIFLSAPLLHVAALSSENVIQGRLDAKQARRALV